MTAATTIPAAITNLRIVPPNRGVWLFSRGNRGWGAEADPPPPFSSLLRRELLRDVLLGPRHRVLLGHDVPGTGTTVLLGVLDLDGNVLRGDVPLTDVSVDHLRGDGVESDRLEDLVDDLRHLVRGVGVGGEVLGDGRGGGLGAHRDPPRIDIPYIRGVTITLLYTYVYIRCTYS